MKLFNDLAKKVSDYHGSDANDKNLPPHDESAEKADYSTCPKCGHEYAPAAAKDEDGNPGLYSKMDPERSKKIMKGTGF